MTGKTFTVPTGIVGPWVIVCEGDADRYFFQTLLKERAIKGFDTPFPAKTDQGGTGRFPDMLQSLERHFDKLTGGVLIVADSKNNEDNIFRLVRKKIKTANKKGGLHYPIPTALNRVEPATADAPAIAIITVPGWGGVGGLETLCLKALASKSPKIRKCVEGYMRCSGADQWGDHETMDKARLQTFIAGFHKNDPNNALKHAVRNGLIPLRHRYFNQIVRFLKSLPRTTQAASIEKAGA